MEGRGDLISKLNYRRHNSYRRSRARRNCASFFRNFCRKSPGFCARRSCQLIFKLHFIERPFPRSTPFSMSIVNEQFSGLPMYRITSTGKGHSRDYVKKKKTIYRKKKFNYTAVATPYVASTDRIFFFLFLFLPAKYFRILLRVKFGQKFFQNFFSLSARRDLMIYYANTPVFGNRN